jgi:hypothetical protein
MEFGSVAAGGEYIAPRNCWLGITTTRSPAQTLGFFWQWLLVKPGN